MESNNFNEPGQKPLERDVWEGQVDRHEIENDEDGLEPGIQDAENTHINADDPKNLAQWAEEFQIGNDELKAVIALRGRSVAEIKKYLSV
jgi:hypothetical protein